MMPHGRGSPRRRDRRSRSTSRSPYGGRSKSPIGSYSRKSRSRSRSSSGSQSPYGSRDRRRRSYDRSPPPHHGSPGHYSYSRYSYHNRRPRRPRGYFPRGRWQGRGRGRGYVNSYGHYPREREQSRESPQPSRSRGSESPPPKRSRPFRSSSRGDEEEYREPFRGPESSSRSFDREKERRTDSYSPGRSRRPLSGEAARAAAPAEFKVKGRESAHSRRSSSPTSTAFRREEPSKPEPAGIFFDPRSLSSVRPPSSINTGLSRKLVIRCTLDERFSREGEKSPDLEENITIAIQRNPHAEISSTSTVRKLFDPELFAILRRKDEGKKPLFDRPEIEMFGHDDLIEEEDGFERRVIKMLPVEHSPRRQAVQVIHTDYKSVVSDVRPVKTWQHIGRPQRSDHYPSTSTHRDEPMESDRFRDRLSENPNDLRHNLSRRRFDDREDSRNMPPRYRRGQEMGEEDRERFRDRDEDSSMERGRDERYSQRRPERMDMLPDVSRRPDKYRQSTEWVSNPEMVPKGSSYFQHDDRDDMRSFGTRRPFRSRPFIRGFRPRGNYRGNPRGYNPNYRGRGYVPRGYHDSDRGRPTYEGRSSDRGEWKHDMFDKLEGDEDKEPSSTTKP